jgi:hypothetical protein
MRRVVRKKIRHKEDGLDLAVDFNADVAINVGRSRPAVSDEPVDAGRPPREDPAQPESDQEGTQP